MKEHLRTLIEAALGPLRTDGVLPADSVVEVQIERTHEAGHGDFASNLAMALAKSARRKPRELAQTIIEALPASPLLDRVEIAGPGFINFFLKPAAFQAVTADILAAGAGYGRDRANRRGRILVEFVSANPTGPMHVGHGRNAAYGDSLANILAAAGYDVHREFYINDAGRQADILAVSVWLRYLERCGERVPFPHRGYPGDYIRLTADKVFAVHGEAWRQPAAAVLKDLPEEPAASEDADEAGKAQIKARQETYLDALIQRARQLLQTGYDTLQRQALDDQLDQIRATLAAFGVRFDRWFSERSLIDSGLAKTAIDRLKATGHVYEKDGAQWLATAAFGDEKDRVLFKAEGTATYFANDLAYHVNKLDRGFPLLLDVWGADHHGYIARVRAAIEALTGRKDALSVQLIQFVTLASGRMGKRSGNFVTLQELITEVGRDATRFFYLLRSHDQHLEFNLDLAKSQSSENPVYYVQYAHARICSVLRQLAGKGLGHSIEEGNRHLALLAAPHELQLLSSLARYPEVVHSAASSREPHQLAHYLMELANDFHVYYNAHKFLTAPEPLRAARLNLCLATRQVVHNGLTLLGVGAPEAM